MLPSFSLAEKVDPMAAMLERIRSGNVALKKVQESVGTVYTSLVQERIRTGGLSKSV